MFYGLLLFIVSTVFRLVFKNIETIVLVFISALFYPLFLINFCLFVYSTLFQLWLFLKYFINKDELSRVEYAGRN